MFRLHLVFIIVALAFVSSLEAKLLEGKVVLDSDDGTEVNGLEWDQHGLDNKYNYLGTDGVSTYLCGLRFRVPDLNQGEEIAYARLRFSSGGGEVTNAVNMFIEGVLQANATTFSQASRPSQKEPKTAHNTHWLIDHTWHSRQYSFFHYHTPEITPLVNEILSLPGWGSVEKVIALTLETQVTGSSIDYVMFTDKGKTTKGDTLLEIYKTVYDTFLGKEMIGRVTDCSAVINMYSLIETDVFIEYGERPGQYTHRTRSLLGNAPETPIEVMLDDLAPDTKYYYRLSYRRAGTGDYDQSEEGHFHTQRKRGSGYSFAIHADEHVTGKHYSSNQTQMDDIALYKVALENVRDAGCDFFLSLGDLVINEGTGKTVKCLDESRRNYLVQREYYNEALHSLPFYFVLGNHEGEQGWWYAPDEPAKNKAVMNAIARRELFPNPAPDGFFSGNETPVPEYGLDEDYYAWEWGDALFVVISPFRYTKRPPTVTYDGWGWTLGKTQYDWLYETLHASDARWKFIFTHHLTTTTVVPQSNALIMYGRGGVEVTKHKVEEWPTFEWGGEDRDGSAVFAEKRPGWAHGPVHDFLVSEGVTAVFHGHDHLFAKQDLDGIVYQECPVPTDSRYSKGFFKQGLYHHGVLMENSGHIQVEVQPDFVKVDYVRAYLPGDGPNGQIDHSYTIETASPEFCAVYPDIRSDRFPINTDIVVDFTDEHSGIDRASISMQIEKTLAIRNGNFQRGFKGSILPIENGFRVKINPDENLEPYSRVRVFYRASDKANHPNWIQGQYAFRTSFNTLKSSSMRVGLKEPNRWSKRK